MAIFVPLSIRRYQRMGCDYWAPVEIQAQLGGLAQVDVLGAVPSGM